MRVRILIILLCGFSCSVYAQKIEVKGKWKINVSAKDILNAGNDYNTCYESSEGEVEFRVKNNWNHEYNGYSWIVYINKQDEIWHPNLKLSVRRTSDGSSAYACYSYIYGGGYYRNVSDRHSFFCAGYRGRDNVELQYKLEGVSLLLPVRNYKTYVTYTIVEY
ncbi:hypothetical protein DF185_09300 [Marinifilum breve]|uniref:Lipocalin-like domain-containing protein n=1 Tax=Marinifilum breve TaxID=2184082 RepID=A0A2V3ZZD6_9BACT|nr:hypothetical protein [Marinifilum breve]PXY01653.1 hypothetical protein DF185_09300 [Marinifilum breve]